MRLPAFSCQTWAIVPAAKFARLTVVDVVPLSAFETTMTVSAPSLARSAAKAAITSGFGPEAATDVSPNAERLPS
jgi:hypothetical protein